MNGGAENVWNKQNYLSEYGAHKFAGAGGVRPNIVNTPNSVSDESQSPPHVCLPAFQRTFPVVMGAISFLTVLVPRSSRYFSISHCRKHCNSPAWSRRPIWQHSAHVWTTAFCSYPFRVSGCFVIYGGHDILNTSYVHDVIAKRRNSLFGYVVRLDDHTPAHRALSQVAAARTGSRSGPGWRRRPGRPRHSWIQQIGEWSI